MQVPKRIAQLTIEQLAVFRSQMRRELDKAVNHTVRGVKKPLGEKDAKKLNKRITRQLRISLSPNGQLRSIIEHSRISAVAEGLAPKEYRSPDKFGLTPSARLNRAAKRFLNLIDNSLQESVKKGRRVPDALYNVREVVEKHSPFRALIAYNTAHAYNLAAMAVLGKQGADRIRINLSKRHLKPDICDNFAGVYSIKDVDLPPYHPYCLCFVSSAVSLSTEDDVNALLEEIFGESSSVNDEHINKAVADFIKENPLKKPKTVKVYADDNYVDQVQWKDGGFNSTDKLEEFMEREYPHMKWDFKDVNLNIANRLARRWVELANEFPEVARDIEYIGSYNSPKSDGVTQNWNDSTAYAHARASKSSKPISGLTTNSLHDGAIGLNPNYFGKTDLEFTKILIEDEKSKWHPYGTSDIESVFVHEFGHHVDNYLNRRSEYLAIYTKVTKDKSTFGKISTLSRVWHETWENEIGKISRYASTQSAEAFAEAFSAHYFDNRPTVLDIEDNRSDYKKLNEGYKPVSIEQLRTMITETFKLIRERKYFIDGYPIDFINNEEMEAEALKEITALRRRLGFPNLW